MDSLLCMRNVWLSFPRGRHRAVCVLADVSLDVHVDELVAVLAMRAHGKTTLLRVAAGADRPDRGNVRFCGRDLWELPDGQHARLLARQIGFVEHRKPDLDLPALDLLALPLLRRCGRRKAYARARGVLERVGLGGCWSQRWETLADWERALLTLARGIACGPRLLLLDDLMVRLGIGATEELGRLLRGLVEEQGFAVLMSVSDTYATTWCDRVATLAGGTLLVSPPSSPGCEPNVIDFPAETPRRASS
jgi:predicted ABC-type transport system involved in lysophospholipase L1 biosynthesis ATPase subunit